jgi:hypothetical protein
MDFPENRTIIGTHFHYRYIDHGAQFRVYAILNRNDVKTGRVIKVPIDFEESKQFLKPPLVARGFDEAEIDRRVHILMHHKQQLPTLLQGMFAEDRHLMQLLGNLKLVPLLARPTQPTTEYFMPLYFTQDHVIPMGEFMHTFRFANQPPYHITLDDTRRVIKLFNEIVKLHYRLWEYGIFDLTFKLENIGVISGKQMGAILVDGAEHTFDPETAEKALANEKWRYPMATERTDHLFLPPILHKEYIQILGQGLTIEEFRRHWKKRSNTVERRAINRLRLREKLARNPEKELALWIKRQTIKEELHSGIPKDRIDTAMIPQSDLLQLISDERVGKMPMTEVQIHEQSERLNAENSQDIWREVYRYSFPLST